VLKLVAPLADTSMSGAAIAMDGFGVSASGSIGYAKFGFTVDNVMATARKVLG